MGKKCNIAFLSTKTINFNQEPDRNNNCNTYAIKIVRVTSRILFYVVNISTFYGTYRWVTVTDVTYTSPIRGEQRRLHLWDAAHELHIRVV